MPILRVKKGKNWQDVSLEKPVFLIGRSGECDYPVESAFISRRHCEIFEEGGGHFVRDLGSRLGTRVNGKNIDATAKLQSGDQIRLSNKFTAVFVDDDWKPSDQTLKFARTPHQASGDRLVALDGPLVNQIFPLDKEVTQIGRDHYSDIYLEVNTVSKHHAEVIRESGGVVLVDKNSSNGTFVGNRRIHRKELEAGDLVRFDWVTFRYENEAFRLGRSGASSRADWDSASGADLLSGPGDPFDRALDRSPHLRSPTERLKRVHSGRMRVRTRVVLGMALLLAAAGMTLLIRPLYRSLFPLFQSASPLEEQSSEQAETWRGGDSPLAETQIYDPEPETFREKLLDHDPAMANGNANADFAIVELVWSPREPRVGGKVDISVAFDIRPETLALTVERSLQFQEEVVAEDMTRATIDAANPKLSFSFRMPRNVEPGPHELWLSFSSSTQTVRRLVDVTLRP